MNVSMKTNKIKFKALETSVYCPVFKDEDFIDEIELDGKFDIETVKTGVRESVELLSYNKSYKPLILEILDVLDQNSNAFLIDNQKYISFYWSGIPIFRIIMNKEVKHNKQLHISLQKYQTEMDDIIKENKTNLMIFIGIGTTVFLGGILVGLSLWKFKSNQKKNK